MSCEEALETLYKRLKDLRKTEEWKHAFDGGVAVIEVKVGTGSDEWHVHTHMICTGHSIDPRILSDVWFKVTGDSFIVDVDEIRSADRAGGYVAKYVTKGFDHSLLDDPIRLAECMRAVAGRRMLVTFGSWYNALGDDEPEPKREWKVVGGLDRILRQADEGDEWAMSIVWGLRCQRGQGVLQDNEPAPPGGRYRPIGEG